MLERLNTLNLREKFLLLAGGFAILVLVVDNLIYRPVAARCRDMDLAIREQSEVAMVDQQDLATGPAIEALYQQMRTRLGQPMPPSEAIDQMKGEIDRLAREANVRLLTIRHLEPKRMPAFMLYTVDIAGFEGPEEALVRFLHSLRAGNGTYKVAKLSISPDDAGKEVRGSMSITRVLPLPE